MESIQNLQSGKTSQEPSLPTKEKTLDVSWKNLHALSNQVFQFLDLREENVSGQKLEQSPETDGPWRGDYSTLVVGGVPQRRKRLALVMDLRGQCAGKVLFEQTGVSGDLDKSVKTWKTIARPSEGCTAGDDSLVGDERSYTLKIRSGCAGGVKEHSCRMN